ncbi:hypothetical protein [Chelativorans alearense]|uniref:hypothetical protein n=1 Tax=Chelativorans alearense TaxID=2681495 RepID=UPI0013D22AAD|nr:hypothetical protein [Chelativorans alearense]
MFNKTKTTENFTVPQAEELNPTIAGLMEKRNSLSEEKAKLREEDRALAESEGPTDVEATRAMRVAEILGNVAPQRVVPTRSRRQEIAERLRDLDEATEHLSREIDTERNRASALAHDRLYPEYKRLVGELCSALASAHAAQVAIHGLNRKIGDAGLSANWMQHHHASWMDRGRHGTIGTFIHEIKQAGLIGERDIPEELTK